MGEKKHLRNTNPFSGIPVNHSKGMIPEEIPIWLQKIFNEMNKLSGKVANHVLLNEYVDGEGIGKKIN